jgi:hypothetical protein
MSKEKIFGTDENKAVRRAEINNSAERDAHSKKFTREKALLLEKIEAIIAAAKGEVVSFNTRTDDQYTVSTENDPLDARMTYEQVDEVHSKQLQHKDDTFDDRNEKYHNFHRTNKLVHDTDLHTEYSSFGGKGGESTRITLRLGNEDTGLSEEVVETYGVNDREVVVTKKYLLNELEISKKEYETLEKMISKQVEESGIATKKGEVSQYFEGLKANKDIDKVVDKIKKALIYMPGTDLADFDRLKRYIKEHDKDMLTYSGDELKRYYDIALEAVNAQYEKEDALAEAFLLSVSEEKKARGTKPRVIIGSTNSYSGRKSWEDSTTVEFYDNSLSEEEKQKEFEMESRHNYSDPGRIPGDETSRFSKILFSDDIFVGSKSSRNAGIWYLGEKKIGDANNQILYDPKTAKDIEVSPFIFEKALQRLRELRQMQ